jgi:hypothetical protein
VISWFEIECKFTFGQAVNQCTKILKSIRNLFRITHITNKSRGMTILQIKCSKVKEIHEAIFGPVQTNRSERAKAFSAF